MEYICCNCKISFARRKRNDRIFKYCSHECSSLARRGTPHSKATKSKIAIALMGNTNQELRRSRATRKKISEARRRRFALVGYLNTPETRKKIGEAGIGRPAWNKGKCFSKKSRQKMSVAALIRFETIENHPAWKGGISFAPYPPIFNGRLKRRIKERDGYICQLCNITEKDHYEQLSVHHVDYDKNNCAVENLITLCRACNSRVNFGRDQWSKFFTEKLQRLYRLHSLP